MTEARREEKGRAIPARQGSPGRRGGRSADPASESKARILKALAHPARVRIFEAVAESEKTVGELARMLGAKAANTSRHLALLRLAGLVATRKEGLRVYYSNAMPCLLPALACAGKAVCEIAEEQSRVAACVKK